MDVWNREVAPLLYRPLVGELPLRLLAVQPGQGDAPLAAELVPTTLAEAAGTYDAMSYTWGSGGPRQITVASRPDDGRGSGSGSGSGSAVTVSLGVQPNAFDMLRDLRRPPDGPPRRVWIDAVCIDQTSAAERAAQVAIMHRVYARAGAVVVWLGRPDADSDRAMDYAAGLDADRCVAELVDCDYGRNFFRFADKSYLFDDSVAKEGEGEGEEKDVESFARPLVAFLSRPWFSRIWVQQEASLCANTVVLCGARTLPWEKLFALAWLMQPRVTGTWPGSLHERLGDTLDKLHAVRIIQHMRHAHLRSEADRPRFTFEEALAAASQYDATDPRDKIYALQNLAEDSTEWQVEYAEVASRYLKAGGLSFLSRAGRAKQAPGTYLPSWAPDYHTKQRSESLLEPHARWQAGGGTSRPSLRYQSDAAGDVRLLPKRLRRYKPVPREFVGSPGGTNLLQSQAELKCLMADEIVYLGGIAAEEGGAFAGDTRDLAALMRQDLEYVAALASETYLDGGSMASAYKLTLILCMDHQEELVDSAYVEARWEELIGWYESGAPGYWDPGYEAPALNACLQNSSALFHFRFAVTRHGYFCLVPRITQLHDSVRILQGYVLPVVTRPWTPWLPPARAHAGDTGAGAGTGAAQTSTSKPGEEAGYAELIGDGYVHGMMLNEARCISDEFDCRHEPTEARWGKILQASDDGRGEAWRTLGLHGQYSKILATVGPRVVKLV
ncbi:hypothetical protein GGR56DRAFT_693877 [Xylariaceae sp. FL0804]|nr:hypothetical protein GGR56DRAFT_693877 [Xylariaceae sp. FL0804]